MTAPDVPFGRLDPASSSYLSALRERVVIFDGAAGTNLQRLGLAADVFGGHQLEGCYEVLALTAPRPGRAAAPLVPRCRGGCDRDQHLRCLLGGPRRVPGSRIGRPRSTWPPLSLARRVAEKYATPERPSLGRREHGPGHQVRHPRPDLLRRPARRLRGAGPRRCSREASTCSSSRPSTTSWAPRRRSTGPGAPWPRSVDQVPLQVQVTIELTGRMLPGTEIAAALTTLDAMQVDVVGLNCATGPGRDG